MQAVCTQSVKKSYNATYSWVKAEKMVEGKQERKSDDAQRCNLLTGHEIMFFMLALVHIILSRFVCLMMIFQR